MEVIYLDNHLLVVNKPAGMLSQEDITGDLDILTAGKALLKQHFSKPGKVFLGLVHRLDRPVSGLMVLARTSKAAARLSEQFRLGLVDKRYLALVDGEMKGQGRLTDNLVKIKTKVLTVDHEIPLSKKAILEWKVLKIVGDQTLLEIKLLTGRPHQIRTQLSGYGHPVSGDHKYGSRLGSLSFGKDKQRSIGLHCHYLSLEHPVRHTPMLWTLPPPDYWPISDVDWEMVISSA